MFQTPHFRETDLGVLHGHIRAHPLGLLISRAGDGIIADLLPFTLAVEGERGMLRAHLSRANPQAQALRQDAAALVVFQGIDHYVTPSWYAQKDVDHKVVPTWNYAVVQVRGRAAIIEDPDWLLTQIGELTHAHEAGRQRPWSVADAPESYVAGQLKGIVGIEIAVEGIEGKFKASQNRPAEDRAGVAAGLEAEGSAAALAMRDLVRMRGGV